MTTNKPPIAAWAPSAALQKLESRRNNAQCILTDGPAELNDVALVRLSDYQRLQAECEELRAELNLWSPIHDEVIRRAEKQHCLQDRCDFEVTIMYEDYAAIDAAMEGDKP